MKYRRWPIITHDDHQAVHNVLDRGILYKGGTEAGKFEHEFAEYVGVKHAFAVDSCTHAIHAALSVYGVGPGDEVVVPAFTFQGTANPAVWLGANLVFADVDPRTYNVTVETIQHCLSERTKAVVAVHLHGLACDIESIRTICDRHEIPVIEDACQAHGAKVRERQVGSIGEIGCFSLNDVKNLPAGQGGVITTDEDSLAVLIRHRITHGAMEDQVSITGGFAYQMPEMTAAVARTQLRRLDGYTQKSIHNAARMNSILENVEGLRLPFVPMGHTHVYHKYRIQLGSADGEVLADRRVVNELLLRMDDADLPYHEWQRKTLNAHPFYHNHHRRTQIVDACKILSSSFVAFDEMHPLIAQDEAVVDEYSNRLVEIVSAMPEITGVNEQ